MSTIEAKSSLGPDEEAAAAVRLVAADGREGRLLKRAKVEGDGTARLEPAAGQEAAVESLRAAIERQPWCTDVTSDGTGVIVAVRDDTAASTRLLSLVVEADVRLIRFEHVRPTLEDVFLRLVGRRPESKVA